ncbi:MAG TPA: hypothetical protein VI457_02420 [Methylococcaceae bacterium]|nr:hypothetical protein [Methylococcaceae bacterium]
MPNVSASPLSRLLALLACAVMLAACTDMWKIGASPELRDLFKVEWLTKTWQEEVQLSDGRVIEITQQWRYERAYTGGGGQRGTIPRETWLRFRLAETNFQEVEWHEKLAPMRFDVFEGKPFIVAYPWTEKEFELYGKPHPAYFGFIYENGQWRRLPYAEIPESQYDANLLIGGVKLNDLPRVSLEEKNSKRFNGRWTLSKGHKRIDPSRGKGWQ